MRSTDPRGDKERIRQGVAGVHERWQAESRVDERSGRVRSEERVQVDGRFARFGATESRGVVGGGMRVRGKGVVVERVLLVGRRRGRERAVVGRRVKIERDVGPRFELGLQRVRVARERDCVLARLSVPLFELAAAL